MLRRKRRLCTTTEEEEEDRPKQTTIMRMSAATEASLDDIVHSYGGIRVIKMTAQALHGLALKCKLINMHELINKSTNDYVTLLPCENGANVNNKG